MLTGALCQPASGARPRARRSDLAKDSCPGAGVEREAVGRPNHHNASRQEHQRSQRRRKIFRFDDPLGYYRVLYAASQPVSCFIETLARFRPDLTLLAELREIEGEDDFIPLGVVPREWCEKRLIGTAEAGGDYADIYTSPWIAHLRVKLADECLRLGLQELDASVIQRASPRRISPPGRPTKLVAPASTTFRAMDTI